MLLPIVAFCQNNNPDSLEVFLEKECDGGKIFTKAERMPSVKDGELKLADSLTFFLKKSGNSLPPQKVTYSFIVTKNAQVVDIKIEIREGPFSAEKQLLIKEALTKYQFMWQTAFQNGHNVCAYIRLEMDFSGDKILVRKL